MNSGGLAKTKNGAANAHSVEPKGKRLLIVEPDSLLRWSLAVYFSKWFDVFPVSSREAAERILLQCRLDALLLSDELPAGSAEMIEALMQRENREARIILMSTGKKEREGRSLTACIEKPFRLAEIARLLNVNGTRA